MVRLYVNFQDNVPQYHCTACSACTSTFGKSLCKIKNRGCCFYFPKFNLIDILRMTKTKEGLNTLSKIVHNEGTEIYHYYIHSKGYFDREGYNKYLETRPCSSNQDYCEENIKDKTMFFRSCPFVQENVGCTLPIKYRTNVCNFFICSEVKKILDTLPLLKEYEEEAAKYSRFNDWQNVGLESILKDLNINLKDNLYECIKILRDIPLEECEFPKLPSLDNCNFLKENA